MSEFPPGFTAGDWEAVAPKPQPKSTGWIAAKPSDVTPGWCVGPPTRLAQNEPEAPPARSLWQEETTEEGHVYYWNTETLERTWERPSDFGAAAHPVQPQAPAPVALTRNPEPAPEPEPEPVQTGPSEEMLEDRGVASFGTWEKQLPKFVTDPRYKILPKIADRRKVFDHFVRHRAKELMQKKSAAKATASTALKAKLMEEQLGDIEAALKLTAHAVRKLYQELAKDLDDKEISGVLDELLAPARKKREEERAAKLKILLEDFGQLLVDCRGIDANTSWSTALKEISEEPRWVQIVELGGAEQDAKKVFEKHMKALKLALAKKQKEKAEAQPSNTGGERRHRDRSRDRRRSRSRDRKRRRRSPDRWEHKELSDSRSPRRGRSRGRGRSRSPYK